MSYGAKKLHPINLQAINKDLNSFNRASRPTPEAMEAIESMRDLQRHFRELNSRIRKLNEKIPEDG